MALPQLRPSQVGGSTRTWRATGTAASLVLAAASWGCAAVPHEYSPVVWPGLVPWRAEGGSNLAALLVVLATAVLLYAWWALRDRLDTARAVRVTTAWWGAPLVLSAPLFSRDVWSYAAQGLLLHTGGDPYTQGVRGLPSPWVESVARTWLDTPAPYGPVFLDLARAVAALSGGHLLLALLLLRLLAVAAVAVLVLAVPALAARLGAGPAAAARAGWLGALAPLGLTHLVSGAHNDALMAAGLVLAALLAADRRWLGALVVVALAAAVKAPAAVAVPFLALLWAAAPGRSTAAVVGRTVAGSLAAAAVFALVSLASGLGFGWVRALSTPGLASTWLSVPTAWGTVAGWVASAAGGDGAAVADRATALLRLIAYGVLAVLLVVLFVQALHHRDDRAAVLRRAGWAVLAVALLSGSFYPWYLLWALPLLAAALAPGDPGRDTRRDTGREAAGRRTGTGLALLAAALSVAVLPGGYSLAYSTTSVGAPLMVLLSLVLLALVARTAARHVRSRVR
ncbi:polyprenol phosphomannose-dependent alpha 1,6 mannosyltransferase MptB [Lapillicoccus jejuensis]|uniref:Alpha-1,6-mannosyltransferase n=1 Tax=Lapillicoccus jejuensis TaxID=402171 RepID=A0A542DZR8_9MICO|nr:polyprenol phosphomannose-dependent alpha 1,6 mannosyltransferase MptB [Lapillicoccus jejuensis]TQJ08587.1 alpha-1,6-mannosyltransferase [Lapillicoccus jejuensis]